jgi:hypothetical protein
MGDKERKFLSSEIDEYEVSERDGHYLKVFDGDSKDKTLTLLVRDDQWESSRGTDYLVYSTSAVAISREDAVDFAKWVLERFDTE